MADKYQYFKGFKFTRDEKTGYYLNSTIRMRMHRFVWLCENGAIPEGYDIHHKDGDKSNNDISNLELLTKSKHRKTHYEEMSAEQKQKVLDNMENKARPAAIEWHHSKEGKNWHREHAKRMIEKGQLNKKEILICEQCGKEFTAVKRKGHHFCSGACHQKWIRAHTPTETRTCIICGNSFECKINSSAKTCSKHCSNIMWHSKYKKTT